MEIQPQEPIVFEFIERASTSVPASMLEDYARRRLHFELRRFRGQVRSVTVRVIDENGPRRGVDTRCVLTVELDKGAPIVVEATTAWPTASITAAGKRAGEIIRRRLDREHGRARRAPNGRHPAAPAA